MKNHTIGSRSLLASSAVRCGLLLGVCLLLLVFKPGGYVLQIANLTLVYIVIALGQNIVLGYSGQISIAQSALAAIGAYGSALLMMRLSVPFVPAALAGIVCAGGFGALLGLLTMRVRTHYLLLVTIGFHVVTLLFVVNLSDITGGPMGLHPVPDIEIGSWVVVTQTQYYVSYLCVAILLLYLAERIRDSRMGIAMFALKDNEKGARAAGINPVHYRVLAMGLAGMYAGVGGVMFGFLIQFLGPESFSLHSALLYLLIVVLGGLGNNWGLIVSTLGLTLLSENLKIFSNYWVLIYGVVIMLVIAVAPGGLVEVMSRLRSRKRVVPASGVASQTAREGA